MKRNFIPSQPLNPAKIFALLLLSFIALHSCQKEQDAVLPETDDPVVQAQSALGRQASQRQPVDTTLLGHRQKLDRTVDWQEAYSRMNGDTVLVFAPVRFAEALYLQSGSLAGTSLDDVTWLRGSQVAGGNWDFQLLTMIPTHGLTNVQGFSGMVLAEDWFGGKGGFGLMDGGKRTKSLRLQQPNTASHGAGGKTMYMQMSIEECVTFYYIECHEFSITGGIGGTESASYTQCDNYTERVCSDADLTLNDNNLPGAGGGSSNNTAPSVAQVKNQIKDKPFALLDIPCEVIIKWLATAKHVVAQAQITKLNNIVRTTTMRPGITTTTIANLQNINNAYSTVVNMDYFPITVNQLPIVNGRRLTPEQFLHHIRTNINSFVNTFYTEFSPYQWYGTNETALWNSSNPLGSVISLDMMLSDNGSVIVSNYSTSEWTFSTIFDPKYGQHPVSGHRDFGFTRNANGSYTFYTRGVDRLTSWDGAVFQQITTIPFSTADALWKSFQSKIDNFVKSNGGSSAINSPEVHRPKWNDVKAVLDGKAPLSTLSKDCPD